MSTSSETQVIQGIPAEFVKRWDGCTVELTPVESFMRFVITHDWEFVKAQDSLNYIAIMRLKK